MGGEVSSDRGDTPGEARGEEGSLRHGALTAGAGQRRWHAERGRFACTKPPWWCALSYQVRTGGKLHPLGGRRLRPF